MPDGGRYPICSGSVYFYYDYCSETRQSTCKYILKYLKGRCTEKAPKFSKYHGEMALSLIFFGTMILLCDCHRVLTWGPSQHCRTGLSPATSQVQVARLVLEAKSARML